MSRRSAVIALMALAAAVAATQGATPPAAAGAAPQGDIPEKFVIPTARDDYIKREEMIPMRDGVKLYTVIVIPKGAHNAPIVLTRTPYDAHKRVKNNNPSILALLPETDWDFAAAGFIRVFQDIRGKYGSEGVYEMTRHPRGPFNSSSTDDTTDAWDTIDWLVKNVPESNGRVGMFGSSYEGWTVVMALLGPHPALKAAVPESPMVDGWMGDDWYHYGALRQGNFDYFAKQTEQKGEGSGVPRTAYDDYETFLAAGSPASYATVNGLDQLGWWRKMLAHPAYDAFWQAQALDRQLAAHPSSVPTLWEQGLWDQEDMWGANHAWLALKSAGHEANNWLLLGPWYHSQANHFGWNIGVFRWPGDTARQFRRDKVMAFFNQYLQDGPPANLPRVTVYSPTEARWEGFNDWPVACEHGCAHPMKPLYLQAGFGLGFEKPTGSRESDAYLSDPAKPVPYLPRPVRASDDAAWDTWLVHDQRFVDGRPDVLTYQTPPLSAPVKIQGAPIAEIIAATTGTDIDIVVKLIDVYPAQYPEQPDLGGYQLPIGMDIFRGRYRESFEHPAPVPANKAQRYRFTLPNQNYTFLPGHRIMVQIQSTLFPLYDRNPQHYVENPLTAQPGDYRKATISVLRSGNESSAVWLPVVPTSADAPK
ncbi:MAG TPA: CocE/NonD family hydrolase [Steroidobacteraceae bacterium]|nr:CocE/NonD family hydrolase [Steroidobacteraceae bacterium]